MLTLDNIGISVNRSWLFRHLSITILSGSILQIYGTNGSGKTSLLRAIAGINNPTEGNVYSSHFPELPLKKPYASYLGHRLAVQLELSVLENLTFWIKLYDSALMLRGAIKYWGLEQILHVPCFRLSAGNLKKVELARLLACKADLWLLDEPDTNLDDQNRLLLDNAIQAKAGSGGIVVIANSVLPQTARTAILNIADFNQNTMQRRS